MVGESDKSQLALVIQPQEYFRELVLEALGHQKLSPQPETEFYLVNLLNNFMKADRLYARDETGATKQEALVTLVKEALDEPAGHLQNTLFRHIGDVSLYVAGFFQDSLNRKLVDVDYYIDIGGSAYQHVANRTDEELHRAIYCELAEKFGAFVDVLAEVSDKTTHRSPKDILRLYEVWVKTRSGRAARALQEAGILPNPTIKKDFQ